MQETGYEVFSWFYDELTQNVGYDKRAEYFHKFIQQYCQSGGKVLLDLACGTGSMSEKMAELGYDVIGIDYSEGMLSQALDKKFDSGLPIQYVCQDMTKLDLYGTVDIAICCLDSLNHLSCYGDVEQTFSGVYQYLEPGGVFVFDMNTLYKHRNLLGNQTYTYETDQVYCVWENTLEEDGATVNIDLNIFELQEQENYKRYIEHFCERAYPLEQIQQGLKKCGFIILAMFQGDTENPVTETTDRVVFVCRKEK